MDKTISKIAEYGVSIAYEDLPVEVVHECKRHILDTLGCAYAAYHAEPSLIARRLALLAHESSGARVLGTRHRSTLELATFANGVMIRYLDGNDAFPGGGGGHPSDTLGALFTVADLIHASGKDLIASITATYDIYHHLFLAAHVQDRGWDHVFYTVVASTVGASKLLNLPLEQTKHAIALAITSNLALEVTRRGELSMWKGCAGANAARNAVFAVRLAAEGMTGPSMAVEGTRGLWDVTGQFDLLLKRNAGDFRILVANLKYFLAEYHAQAPITVALTLHGQVNLNDVQSVTVYTYQFAWERNRSNDKTTRVMNRETADHSISYMVAAVLIDGSFSDSIFTDERLNDERIYRLMERITVVEDPEYTRAYPQSNPCRIEIRLKSGENKSAAVDYPLGHAKNPMSDGDVEAKFRALASRTLESEQISMQQSQVWQLEQLSDTSALFDHLAADCRSHQQSI